MNMIKRGWNKHSPYSVLKLAERMDLILGTRSIEYIS